MEIEMVKGSQYGKRDRTKQEDMAKVHIIDNRANTAGNLVT